MDVVGRRWQDARPADTPMNDDAKRSAGAEEGFEGVAPRLRVQLTYRPRAAAEDVELPFRMLVLGDFTQRPDPRSVEERRPIEIDKDRFAAVMREQKLDIAFSVDEAISDEPGRRLDVRLRFRRLSDMEPEAVANQVPLLKALMELRQALTALKGPLGGEKAFRNALQRRVEDPRARHRLREEIGLPIIDEAVNPPLPRPLPPDVAAERDEAVRTTRAEWLMKHAENLSAAVRAAVAENPDTPPDTLFKLSHTFPKEVARNPALPLLAIEHPNWLSRLSERCLPEVLRLNRIAAPEALLAQMSASPTASTRTVAAGDPRTPPAALSSLAGDRSWYVGPALLRNPSLPLETWRAMVSDPDLVEQGAHYPYAPADWLRARAQSPSVAVRAAVAGNPGLPADAIPELARDPERNVRSRIAARADLPEDVARELAVDADVLVRGQIAANPCTPLDLLPALAEQEDAVRNGLLGNLRVPAALRERVCQRNRQEWSTSSAALVVSLVRKRETPP